MRANRLDVLKTVGLYLVLYLAFWILYGALFQPFVGSRTSPSSVLFGEIGSGLTVFLLLRDAMRTDSMTYSEIGIAFEPTKLNAVFGLLLGGFLWMAAGIISDTMKQVLPNWAVVPPKHSYRLLYLNSEGMSKVILFFILVFMTPVIEEVFHRGLIYSMLRREFSITAALVLSSGIFGLLHVYLELAIPAFLIGSGLTLLRERRKTLFGSIIAHATINCLTLAFS